MIALTKDFALTADDNCFIVGKPRQKPDGKTVIEKPKYYSTVHQAIQATIVRTMRQAVKNEDVTTLEQFLEKQEELHSELWELIEPFSTNRPRQRADSAT